ncbi:protein-glutamate O-methyltransferase CheR [Georgenia sp. SYP-B2076]|uniref:CheR family methyltransferase n=1 Tax=Georgenia sp. SYP-B2076 TaxID=2495881 RepID=UPI000F8F3F32|nr:protein-glutamate O-methyltransferase CheR [Georgenia sp. SYP-B2076]
MSLPARSVDYVAELVRRASAVELDGKEYLVRARLAPLARAEGIRGRRAVEAYIDLLRERKDEAQQERVVEAMVTTETSWFRDGEPFAVVPTALLPTLPARAGGPRLWSAGCSTGQEPYSLAMVLLDAGVSTFSLLATDISSAVLERAQAGRYDALEVSRGLPRQARARYFRRADGGWRVRDEVRARVDFRRHNLLGGATSLPQTFDVVFLRHVLMYFDLPNRALVLGRVRERLAPGGFLVLGAAETPLGVDEAWERVPIRGTSIYQPIGGAR